jgi:hypothetical protein
MIGAARLRRELTIHVVTFPPLFLEDPSIKGLR